MVDLKVTQHLVGGSEEGALHGKGGDRGVGIRRQRLGEVVGVRDRSQSCPGDAREFCFLEMCTQAKDE